MIFKGLFKILLLLSKGLKIIRIKLAYLCPTFYAKIYLTLMNCSFGRNLKVCGVVYFRPGSVSSITLGDNVALTARFLTNSVGLSNPTMLECIKKGKIEIGNNSGLSSSILSARQLIKIGDNVNIGGNVRIFDHDFHSLNYLNRRNNIEDSLFTKSNPVIIEDDVFIGTNSIILKGVHIGARSIIAAGSIVTLKTIPSDSLVAGNPAKIIKTNIN